MTTHPKSPSGTPSHITGTEIDTKTKPSDLNASHQPEEETRPSHTAEIGTLKKLSVPGGTAWLGSSSGVYFVNTVRRAFSAAFAANSKVIGGNPSPDTVPPSEDIITGDDATGPTSTGGTNTLNRDVWWLHDADIHRRIVAAVGRPPVEYRVAMDLVTTYFRTTHPLFPFLHGPKFLDDVNEIYTALSQHVTQPSRLPAKSNNSAPRPKRTHGAGSTTSVIPNLGNIQSVEPLKLITFQIIINIAALSHGTTTVPVPSLPAASMIHSPHALLALVLPLSTTPLLPTIQLLLSAELYLLSTVSLRHSSTLAGLVLRLIYHTGLHRCPLRYATLTPQDCEIRKRIFWSAYALDRHLSLALGDPNSFQDSDIDVCLSRDGDGEMHRAVARDLLTEEERECEMKLHYPRDGSGKRVLLVDVGTQKPAQRVSVTNDLPDEDAKTSSKPLDQTLSGSDPASISNSATVNDNDNADTNVPSLQTKEKQLREAALTAYVQYGKLTGRIIEIFHKSINFRFPKDDAISFLSADIENWWNDLPPTLTGDSATAHTTLSTKTSLPSSATTAAQSPIVTQHQLLTPFFTLLYHQLLLLLHRPSLSLDQSSAPFTIALQTCIRASRATLSSLTAHRANGQSMFLPGLLSAAWMSGLIIAFACQLGKYPVERAVGDINVCLGLLRGMDGSGGRARGNRSVGVSGCVRVLELLVGDIEGRGKKASGASAVSGAMSGREPVISQTQRLGSGSTSEGTTTTAPSRKRTHDSLSMEASESQLEPSPKRDPPVTLSPASSDFRPRRFRSPETKADKIRIARTHAHPQSNTSTTTHTHSHPHGPTTQQTNAKTSDTTNPANAAAIANFFRSGSTLSDLDFPKQPLPSYIQPATLLNHTSASTSTSTTVPVHPSGAALYANPQDVASAQSTHSMGLDLGTDPGLGLGMGMGVPGSSTDDQMFWGGMDGNLFDVFGAVSWENMTGLSVGNGNGEFGGWEGMGMGMGMGMMGMDGMDNG